MLMLFWDASALAKRYYPEVGSETVDALFSAGSATIMASTPWNYAETYSILLRRKNGGVLKPTEFSEAINTLEREVRFSSDFLLYPIESTTVFASIAMMQKHNINATDAALLTLLLEIRSADDAPSLLLLASDERLLRAAQSEGFAILNPQIVIATEIPVLLAAL